MADITAISLFQATLPVPGRVIPNDPAGARVPKTNIEYWTNKVERNRKRDRNAAQELKASGWDVLVMWECELKDQETLLSRVEKFLG